MFRADIRAMSSAADEMQRQIRKLNQQVGNTEDVKNGLSGLSGMDGIRRQLQKEMDALEVQQRQLRQNLPRLAVRPMMTVTEVATVTMRSPILTEVWDTKSIDQNER